VLEKKRWFQCDSAISLLRIVPSVPDSSRFVK
jgi:hypothetical protein